MENKFPFKIEVRWTIPDVLNSQGEKNIENPFKVDLEHVTIDANSSASFKIKFKPFEPDYYFFQVMQ